MTSTRMRACGFIILLSITSGCARSPEARRDKYIAKGKEFVQKRDYPRAILEFRNATQVMPKDAEAQYQLGMAAAESGDLRTAAVVFRKALEFNPKHVGAQLRLAQMMAGASSEVWLNDAENRLKALMESSSVTPEMLNTLALTELKLGKTEDALENLQQALMKAPRELQSSIMLARVKLSQNDLKGAEEVLKKACEAAPDVAAPRIVLGRFYLAQKKTAEAEAQFQQALKGNPKNGPALMDLATLQSSLGRKQEAEQNFKLLADLGQTAYQPVHALFLFGEGRREEAVRELEELYNKNSEDRLARTRLIVAYRAVNRPADAEKVLAQVLKKNSKDLDALIQRGEMFLLAGKYPEAEADLNQVLRLKPNSAEVHYILAKLYATRGTTLRYRQELSESLRLNPYLLPVRLELVQSYVAGKEPKAAADLLNTIPEDQKQLTSVIVQRNWVLWALDDLSQMRKGIDLALSRERSMDVLLQDGLWKLRAGNPSGARAALEEALKVNPEDLRALAAMKQAYVAQKQAPAALQKIKEYAARQPKSAPIQQFLGMMLLANGDLPQARAAFQAAKVADTRSSSADLSLVQLDAVEGKWDDAIAKLKGVVATEPGNLTARLWLGDIETIKGNHDAAITQFRYLVEANPNNPQALNNLAYLLAEYRKQPDEALKMAQKAQELAPDDPDYADTMGWILYQKGLYSLAVKQLERAASKSDNPAIQYHLAMAYAKAGDPDRARGTLGIALKRNPQIPEAKIATELVGRSN